MLLRQATRTYQEFYSIFGACYQAAILSQRFVSSLWDSWGWRFLYQFSGSESLDSTHKVNCCELPYIQSTRAHCFISYMLLFDTEPFH